MKTDVIEKAIEDLHIHFLRIFYNDFGSLGKTSALHSWHTLTWEAFRFRMAQEGVHLSDCPHRDWEQFFREQQEKINALYYQLKETGFA